MTSQVRKYRISIKLFPFPYLIGTTLIIVSYQIEIMMMLLAATYLPDR